MRRCAALLCLCCLLTATGCASRQNDPAEALTGVAGAHHRNVVASLDDDDAYLDTAFDSQLIPDPLEPWNRAMFVLNDGFITYLGRPLNTAYTTVTPGLLRDCLHNFFTNLLFPVRFTNSLLQGKGHEAGLEFSRFVINTGAGIGGLFNVAGRHPELQNLDAEDTGQTLAVWGVGEGFYLYWPLLGPSTARDSVGLVGDYFLDPLTYLSPWQAAWSVKGLRTVNELDSILDAYDSMIKSAIEPYAAIRDAFVQYRRAKVAK